MQTDSTFVGVSYMFLYALTPFAGKWTIGTSINMIGMFSLQMLVNIRFGIIPCTTKGTSKCWNSFNGHQDFNLGCSCLKQKCQILNLMLPGRPANMVCIQHYQAKMSNSKNEEPIKPKCKYNIYSGFWQNCKQLEKNLDYEPCYSKYKVFLALNELLGNLHHTNYPCTHKVTVWQ